MTVSGQREGIRLAVKSWTEDKLEEIKFKTGEFQLFVATRKFTVGDTGVDIKAGSEVSFDGITVRYDGQEFPFAKLRGVLKIGWLVPAASYDAEAPQVAVSANVMVRSATKPGNPLAPPERQAILTTASDERVIVNSNHRAANVQVRNTQARTASVNPNRLVGKAVTGQNGYKVVVEEQDGTPVRSLSTRAVSATEMNDNNLWEANQQLKNLQFQPQQGNPKSEEDRLQDMSEADRDSYLAKKAEKQQILESDMAKRGAKGSSRVVASVVKKTPGVTVSKGSTEVEFLDEKTGPGKVTEVYVDGIKISNLNGPGTVKRAEPVEDVKEAYSPKIERDGTADARRKMAKAICPDFPDSYSFSEHWKRRLARIRLDYETRPDIIRAIFAAESDDFKKALVEDYPDVFAG